MPRLRKRGRNVSKYTTIKKSLNHKEKHHEERNYKIARKQLLNGNSKSLSINNYFKCNWIKFSS